MAWLSQIGLRKTTSFLQPLVLTKFPFTLSHVGMLLSNILCLKIALLALASVAQWIECQHVNHRVASSIPSQDKCLGCGPSPQLEVHERQPHTDISFPLFLPLFPCI